MPLLCPSYIKSSKLSNAMSDKPKPPIYMARMPEVFGYGLVAFSHISESDALYKVKMAYIRTYIHLNNCAPEHIFKNRFEYYGGSVHTLDTDKVYDTF